MTGNIICILIAIVVYLVGMVAIGVYYSKGQSDAHEFYLGGRKLGPIVTALSTEASDMSAYLLMGVPGLAFFCGIAEASWTAIGLALGTYLNWLFVAKRLRRYSVRLGALTLPEYISRRFYDNTKLIELIGAITIIVFYVPYTASGFSACGKLFGTLFGYDYVPTMIISAAVIVAYTACGGFKAASVTSLVQSLIMVFALAVVLIFGINSVGGWENVVANAKAIPGYLSMTATTSIQAAEAGEFGTLKIISTLAWALGYFGMPHVVLHFMAIEDENKLKLSRRVATIWVVVSLSVAVIIGIVGYSMAKENIIAMFGDASSAEALIVSIAAVLSEYGAFFAILAGLVLAGILAATMSTADVQLLAAASAIAQNIIRGVFGVELDELHIPRRILRMGRLRRNLRPHRSVLALLEALQQMGRDSRHVLGRGNGIHLEIRNSPHRRRVCDLRAAARVRNLLHLHRGCFPAYQGSRRKDLRGLRRSRRNEVKYSNNRKGLQSANRRLQAF